MVKEKYFVVEGTRFVFGCINRRKFIRRAYAYWIDYPYLHDRIRFYRIDRSGKIVDITVSVVRAIEKHATARAD